MGWYAAGRQRQMGCFAHPPLDTVALNRIADFFGNRIANPDIVTSITGNGASIALAHLQHKRR